MFNCDTKDDIALGDPKNECEYTTISDLRLGKVESLNVLHLNIRSFHKNYNELILLLDDLAEKEYEIDILLLCETFLNQENLSLNDIPGFKGVHRCRQNRIGGGLSIYINDTLKYECTIDSPFNSTLESLVVKVKSGHKDWAFCEFYRVPNGNLSQFNEYICEVLQILKKFDNVVIACDQNLDLIKMGTHKETNKFYEKMLASMYIPTINKPTRVTYTTSTLIDNVYLKMKKVNNYDSFIITDCMSDHYPCLVSIDSSREQKCDRNTIKTRKLNDTAMCKINQQLLFDDWSVLYELSVNACYEMLIDRIQNALNTHAL